MENNNHTPEAPAENTTLVNVKGNEAHPAPANETTAEDTTTSHEVTPEEIVTTEETPVGSYLNKMYDTVRDDMRSTEQREIDGLLSNFQSEADANPGNTNLAAIVQHLVQVQALLKKHHNN